MAKLIKQPSEGVEKTALRDGQGRAVVYAAPLGEQKSGFTFAARIELEPGASVGFHCHDHDEEVYALISGEGIFLHDTGESPIKPGDLFVTQKGMSHGLRNTGTEPLVFFALVAQ